MDWSMRGKVTPLTPSYAHGVLICECGSSMRVRFSHGHEVLVCECEGIARTAPSAVDSKTTISRRWCKAREVNRETRRQNEARIDEQAKGRTNGSGSRSRSRS